MDSSPVGRGENQILSDTCLGSSFITIIFPVNSIWADGRFQDVNTCPSCPYKLSQCLHPRQPEPSSQTGMYWGGLVSCFLHEASWGNASHTRDIYLHCTLPVWLFRGVLLPSSYFLSHFFDTEPSVKINYFLSDHYTRGLRVFWSSHHATFSVLK